ncbi:MAG: hypothetical protein CMJ35_14100 [Phycisphaerae bacterium]|nr:hypothetical protein [Phycisphaerae bacterium]MBM91411.1 hypothetical protein [Phycisphaerae bacterium]MBM92721.1 hypothetical protein [Phycisphaerae bacterium]HCT44644.1 hypothetical protein [Phycisphaerales bacterium]|tara:strand:- start:267 stop:1007 length:741 start_codon:yes stop_codon:yes gene_type:complete
MTQSPLLSFDIETANIFELKPGESFEKYEPFDITVAATGFSEGESCTWYSTDESGRPAPVMTRHTASKLLAYLDAQQNDGVRVCAWNGTQFDLQWIGYVADDYETAGRVALRAYDPMLQFFWARGFPVGLAKVGQAMGIEQEKLMLGEDAPVRWRDGDYESVISYVVGDVEITNKIVAAVEREKAVKWVTRKGTTSVECMPQLLQTHHVLKQPLPDQSWMDEPIDPWGFTKWIPRSVLEEFEVPRP